MNMDREKIKKYKQKLLEEKSKLQNEIKNLDIPPDMGDEPGSQDEAKEAQEFYNQQAEADVFRNRLADVELALYRIQKGTYGKCIKCEEKIEQKRLNADAATELCNACFLKYNK